MPIIKRIIASIFRKPFKSLLLISTFFVLGSFVGASYSIYQSTKNIEKEIKNSIDVYATIRLKEGLVFEDKLHNVEMKEIQFIYDQLKKNPAVVMSNINKQNHEFNFFDSKVCNPNIQSSSSFYEHFISFLGVDPSQNMIFDDSSIMEGRNFTQEDYEQHKNYVLVQENFTYIDGSPIQIGDILPFYYYIYNNPQDYDHVSSDIVETKTFEFEVIGKYRDFNHNSLPSALKESLSSTDFIILSNVFESLLQDVDNFDYSKPFVLYDNKNLIFKLNSVDDIEIFNFYFDSLNKLGEDLKLITNADGYLEIKGTLKNMNLMSITFFVIACMASVLVGIMVIHLFLKDRNHEIGILVAIGETKKRILATLVSEIVILGLIGLLLSIGGGNLAGRKISNDIFENQLKTSEISENDINTIDYKHEVMSKYHIDITKEYVSFMLSGGCLVLIISSVFPIISVMRSKPKDILL